MPNSVLQHSPTDGESEIWDGDLMVSNDNWCSYWGNKASVFFILFWINWVKKKISSWFEYNISFFYFFFLDDPALFLPPGCSNRTGLAESPLAADLSSGLVEFTRNSHIVSLSGSKSPPFKGVPWPEKHWFIVSFLSFFSMQRAVYSFKW